MIPDRIGPEEVRESFSRILAMQAMLLAKFAECMAEKLGRSADDTLRQALEMYGTWRGRWLRDRHEARGLERNAGNLLLDWDNGNFYLARRHLGAACSATPGLATLEMAGEPLSAGLERDATPAVAEAYFAHLLPALANAYDPDVTATARRQGGGWAIELRGPGDTATALEPEDSDEQAMALLRRSGNVYGGLYIFLARAVLAKLGVAGDGLIRDAVRRIGVERGTRLREAHRAAGMNLNLQTLMENYDGPIVGGFEWEEGELTPERWHQDCTYCPYFDAWQQLGERDLGWLYDEELHPAMFQAYHPGVRIKFVANKTWGDRVCGFRFDVVEGEAPPHTIAERKR
jgi:hypothetical protein